MANKVAIKQKNINSKISEAVELLNTATKEEVELAKDSLNTKAREALNFIDSKKLETTKKLNKNIKNARKSIASEPFKSLMLIGFVSVIIGFLFGRRK